MSDQVHFEDVSDRTALPGLEKCATTQQLVMYAGASGDFNPIHYDLGYARSAGLSNVILHGALKSAFLVQLVTDWMGERGALRTLNVLYRGMDEPGQALQCGGRVKRKYVQDGEHLVEFDLWIENPEGQQTTRGSAVVSLPSRGPVEAGR